MKDRIITIAIATITAAPILYILLYISIFGMFPDMGGIG